MKKVVIVIDHFLALLAIAVRLYLGGISSGTMFFCVIGIGITIMLSAAWFMLND